MTVAHPAIAWSFPAGEEPSFRILQLFQKEMKRCKATTPNSIEKGWLQDVAPSSILISVLYHPSAC